MTETALVRRSFIAGFMVIAVLFGATVAMGAEVSAGRCDLGASDLGQRVLAVQNALDDPTAPGALEAIKVLGLSSGYYVMVRGWLSMQLVGDRSIESARGDTVPQDIRERIDFLEQAIRAIDLE